MDTENPYAVGAKAGSVPMRPGQLRVPLSRIFVAWLCFFLVATLGGALLGTILGVIIGGALGAAGTDLNTIALLVRIAGFFVAMPVSFLCYWWSVNQYILKKLTPPSVADELGGRSL